MTSPVEGLMLSNVLPDLESTHSPLINSCFGLPSSNPDFEPRSTVIVILSPPGRTRPSSAIDANRRAGA